jgi:hypothetical protein
MYTDPCVLVRVRACAMCVCWRVQYKKNVYFETCVLVLYFVSFFSALVRARACSLQKPTFSHQYTDPCVFVRAEFVFASVFNTKKWFISKKSKKI